MRRPIRFAGMVLIVLTVVASRAAGNTPVCFVPWKVLEPGDTPAKKAFVLFWVPSSPEEMRHSDLITSERLTRYAGRCIGMHVVRADDSEMLTRLNAGESLPVAVLVEGDREVARAPREKEPLSANVVEAMVREAFDTREVSLNAALDQAGRKASSGDSAGAIELYRQVAAQQCAFPRQAKTAQRALRRLGVKD